MQNSLRNVKNTEGGTSASNRNIAIIGAGLAGSLLAIYLAKKGFKVDVYERRPDMRKHNIDGGRSINLTLSARGIYALKEVELYDDIKKISIQMFGRMIHPLEGELTFQRYGKDDTEYILHELSEGIDNVDKTDWQKAGKLIEEKLDKIQLN